MSSEYIKHNGQRKKKREVISRGKKYKYNKTGKLVEIGGTDPDTGATVVQGADDFVIGGTKSSLRRIADLESNVAILYTQLTTSDGDAASSSEDSDDVTIGKANQTTRFKGDVKFEKEIDVKSSASVTSDFADKVMGAASNAVATQTFVYNRIDDLVNGASSSFDTLKEIQNAMATDAELSAAISGLTIGNGTVTLSAGNGLSGGGAFSMNQTNSETVSFAMSGSYSGTFTATGDVCAYSDASLKTNIETIEGALGKVESIRGVTFDRIEDGSTSTGVVAQELEAVLPEAVHTDANGTKMVAYGNVTGLLIEAVKELSAQVAELKK